ncbi:hypothetical protein [Ligilactobacillus agilis]|uniref:hypothetical protein n=1 Tax=Ligilactobacillus agilis TaxID=1601 RepID=UPI0014379357|nr:hypothetical protein [Ligilactobacillus agilis]GET09903.1 hypothetical protein SN10121_03930 [Ligilactobacillus agilis]
MTNYNLDLSTDNETVKFHSNFGFALDRYAILVTGNGNKVLYHLDGLDKVDSLLEWLHTGKVISQNVDWFKGSNENKLKSLAWLDGVNVAIVDNNKLLRGENDYIVVADEELDGAINRYVYKVKNNEY